MPKFPPRTDLPRRRGAVAVVMREGRLLVIRRSRLVRAPLKYCFPGGHIEPEETEEDALRREVREELSVEATPLKRLWETVTPWNIHLAWWQASLAPDQHPQPNAAEVESFHWYTPEQIRRLPRLLESNRDFLDAHARGEFTLEPF